VAFVTLNEILADCQSEGADGRHPWAVPAFDVINMETVYAALGGAVAERAPVILMVLPGHTPVSMWPGLVAMIRAEAERSDVPVCLHLDHAKELEPIRAALDLDFSSVMIDGSTLPLADNIALTRQAVEEAHARGVSVEAELGHVGMGMGMGAEESGDEADGRHPEDAGHLTRVDEAAQFVSETQVDALAVSIGTIHGLYRGEPKLDFERLEALRQVVTVPMVLHGGSGTPDEHIRRAVAGGISKINIWTEVRLAYLRTLQEQVAVPAERCPLHTALLVAQASAQEVVQQKIRLLGAAGRVA